MVRRPRLHQCAPTPVRTGLMHCALADGDDAALAASLFTSGSSPATTTSPVETPSTREHFSGMPVSGHPAPRLPRVLSAPPSRVSSPASQPSSGPLEVFPGQANPTITSPPNGPEESSSTRSSTSWPSEALSIILRRHGRQAVGMHDYAEHNHRFCDRGRHGRELCSAGLPAGRYRVLQGCWPSVCRSLKLMGGGRWLRLAVGGFC